MSLIKLTFIMLSLTSVHVSCSGRVRNYFTSFDFSWDAMSMFITTDTWFNKEENSGLTLYLVQERIRPSCRAFLNSPMSMGGALLTEQFNVVANCLSTAGIMDGPSSESERDDFVQTLGKTACRMKNLHNCSRQPTRNVFYPNNPSANCPSTDIIQALAKLHNLMSCVIDMNGGE